MCHIFLKTFLNFFIFYSIFACMSVANADNSQLFDSLRANGTQIIDTAVSPEFRRKLDNKLPFVAVIPNQRADEGIANRITTACIQAGWSVIERSQLEHVLSEQKLSMSGLLEQETRLTIGKILGIKFIIICKEGLGDDSSGRLMNGQVVWYLEGSVKIIDIETGAIMASSSFKWMNYQAQTGPQWIVFDINRKLQSIAYQTTQQNQQPSSLSDMGTCRDKCAAMHRRNELKVTLEDCIRTFCK